ncbi:hypothetical protein B0J13DRAFT_132382 [Dactylonectria estremocensis]|uniref:Uncharacterized protein n=1 Tax=Dactylonectria estremocensis TaxID=1079267 RepID=A0A9P9IQU8_9HYPO|nr:hypothetical protein B0J13DRAFT_132382 [Dactylonectria estremocensis]
MATLQDQEPLLHSSNPSTESEPELIEKYEQEAPTASHALAEESKHADLNDKGASQMQHDHSEVRDLGWNDGQSPNPVVGGLDNAELWTLIRRFDKQVFRVKRIDEPPLGQLDFNIAEDEDFSPDKLRAQLERFYMIVVASLFSFWKHVVRLRSWREHQRTSAFLAVYTVAWLLDLLIPMAAAFIITLIIWDPAREICFPPAPPALIDSKSGGVKKPAAGVLASKNSLTGAPEKHEGEAVEQEARNFVTTLSAVIISTAAGKQPQADSDDELKGADPGQVIEDAHSANEKASGLEPAAEHDRTRKPVSDAVWAKARPTLRLLSDFIDNWERFGNALNPTAPFPILRQRLFLASVILPALLGSLFTSPYMAFKAMGFICGFLFFGDPLITRGVEILERTYPRWAKYVELRNTILQGVPTNAQLAVTLLRIGERNKAPLPPPPASDVPPPVVPHDTAGQNLDHLGATNDEIEEAVQPGVMPEETEEEDKKTHKKSHRIMNIIRGTTKGGVRAAFAADKAKAKAGASHAKNRLGVIQDAEFNPETGPIRFPARHKGKEGHAYIITTATTPSIGWTADIGDVSKAAWVVTMGEITELQKLGGLGWKSKMIVGWAMGREVVDGLTINTEDGRELHLTAVVMRDQLFNRLISIGSQMWELR